MQTTEQTTQTGFTLIEIMIAVVIVAVLAAIAVPNYNRYVEKSRRTDATTALTRIAANLERCYTQFSRYNHDDCEFTFVSDGAITDVNYAALAGAGTRSEDGDYDITVGARAGGTAAQSFQLTATARDDGRQANDDICDTFTLSNVGVKNSTPAPAAGAENRCW